MNMYGCMYVLKFTYREMHMYVSTCMYACRGSLYISQISYLLQYPSHWLLVSGLSSQFYHLLPLCNMLLISAVVGNIFEKWLQASGTLVYVCMHVCMYAYRLVA